MACSSCEDLLGEDFAACSVKNCQLHFHCAGIQEKTWRNMSAAKKEEWKCPECRKIKDSKSDQVTTEVLTMFFADVKKELSKLNALSGLEEMKKTVQETKTLAESVERAIQFMSNGFEEIKTQVTEIAETSNSNKKDIEVLKVQLKERDSKIAMLEARIINTEQYARNKNLEIINVEESSGENLRAIMEKLAHEWEVPLAPGDIDVVHRVPTQSRGAPAKIIVQFMSRTIREAWLEKRRQGIECATIFPRSKSTKKIYMNRHLAEHWRTLLWEAKQKGKDLGYNFIWFHENKIKARKNAEDRAVVTLVTKADLDKLV